MKLTELAEKGTFVITSEIGPPKGTDFTAMKANLEHMRGRVHAVNVTDQQNSVMRLSTLASSVVVKSLGFEPVYQCTCRDRNRIALQSDLLGAAASGIQNILCLTGDYVSLGDHPGAKPVFDLDSVSLIAVAKMMRDEGRDMAGRELSGRPDFAIGAVAGPCSDDLETQVLKLEKKAAAGAQFIQTQAVYGAEQFEKFMSMAGHIGIPVFVGILLLKSARMARFMNNNVPGISVPGPIIAEMENAKDPEAAGVRIAARLINEMKDMCSGVHIMAMGWEKLIPEILSASRLS